MRKVGSHIEGGELNTESNELRASKACRDQQLVAPAGEPKLKEGRLDQLTGWRATEGCWRAVNAHEHCILLWRRNNFCQGELHIQIYLCSIGDQYSKCFWHPSVHMLCIWPIGIKDNSSKERWYIKRARIGHSRYQLLLKGQVSGRTWLREWETLPHGKHYYKIWSNRSTAPYQNIERWWSLRISYASYKLPKILLWRRKTLTPWSEFASNVDYLIAQINLKHIILF